MRAGRRFILVIDEAQNLSEEALESVRLLSNFETPWMKLMQIVLAGQPQLAEKLAKPSMAQLRQRVSFSIRIEPLTGAEVDAYVDHRLWVAGYSGPSLFSAGAQTLLAEYSEDSSKHKQHVFLCNVTRVGYKAENRRRENDARRIGRPEFRTSEWKDRTHVKIHGWNKATNIPR